MPAQISKAEYRRLKGAYMGVNSFDNALENWPIANWGKLIIIKFLVASNNGHS